MIDFEIVDHFCCHLASEVFEGHAEREKVVVANRKGTCFAQRWLIAVLTLECALPPFLNSPSCFH